LKQAKEKVADKYLAFLFFEGSKQNILLDVIDLIFHWKEK